ncbi:MAG: acetyl-CoA carboxylase biotin carboxyl carrier protein [Allorhizobium sp.]
MDLILIGRLMEMLENSTLNDMDVTENGVRIRLSKSAGMPRQAASNSPSGETPEISAAAEIAALMALPQYEDASAEFSIVAGLPGTFYRSPSPGAAPYVEVGDLVEEGQTLALIEAMKMLNPVEATTSGRVVAILIDDATPVAPGAQLILLEKAD